MNARWAVARLLSVILAVGVIAKGDAADNAVNASAAASHLPGRSGVPDGPGGCPSHLRVGEQGVDA